MANFISEDMIEQAILNKLRQENFGYDVIVCDTDPSHREYLNDGTGRANKRRVCCHAFLRRASAASIPMCRMTSWTASSMTSPPIFRQRPCCQNYELYNKLRNYIQVATRRDGKGDFELVKLIDFDRPKTTRSRLFRRCGYKVATTGADRIF